MAGWANTAWFSPECAGSFASALSRRGSWSDKVGLELWSRSWRLPRADCLLLGLQSLHTDRGREGASDLNPFEDLVRPEWQKKPPSAGLARSFLYLPPKTVRTYHIYGCRLDFYGVALCSGGAVPTFVGWYRARAMPSQLLRDGTMVRWCRPDFCDAAPCPVVLSRLLRGSTVFGQCCPNFCWAALCSGCTVLTFAG